MSSSSQSSSIIPEPLVGTILASNVLSKQEYVTKTVTTSVGDKTISLDLKEISYNCFLIRCLILFLDSTTWFMQFKPQFTLLLKIVNCLFFVLGTEIITLFWNTQVEIMNLKSRAKKPLFVTIQILALVQIIAIILNAFFGYFYTIENANFITNKTTGNLQYIYSMIIFIVSLYFAITTKTSMKIKAPFIAINILPLCVSILQLFHYTLSFMYISVLAALIILYVNIQVDMGHRIEEFKNKVMISQIQPHFLYNVLTTISNLCVTDPEEAEETTVLFSQYLRTNLDSLRNQEPVPFATELDDEITRS